MQLILEEIVFYIEKNAMVNYNDTWIKIAGAFLSAHLVEPAHNFLMRDFIT